MGDFVRLIAEKIYEIWPFRIVRVYQRGVRFWLGRVVGEQLGPGLYSFLPFFGSIEMVDVVEDVVDLPTQSVTTNDGKGVTFSANVCYEITDAVLHWTAVQDFHDNMSRAACSHLAVRVREQSYADLSSAEGQKKLEASLKGTLTTKVRPWGVQVLSVNLTDLVAAKHFRLIP